MIIYSADCGENNGILDVKTHLKLLWFIYCNYEDALGRRKLLKITGRVQFLKHSFQCRCHILNVLTFGCRFLLAEG